MVRLLTWNVRGLNDSDKRVLLRIFSRVWNCDLICLQETKFENAGLSDIRSIWVNHHVGFLVLKVIGSTGGVLVLWSTNTFQLISSSSGGFSIT